MGMAGRHEAEVTTLAVLRPPQEPSAPCDQLPPALLPGAIMGGPQRNRCSPSVGRYEHWKYHLLGLQVGKLRPQRPSPVATLAWVLHDRGSPDCRHPTNNFCGSAAMKGLDPETELVVCQDVQRFRSWCFKNRSLWALCTGCPGRGLLPGHPTGRVSEETSRRQVREHVTGLTTTAFGRTQDIGPFG